MNLLQELNRIIPESSRVTTNETVMKHHSQDFSHHEPILPDVVVFPKDVQEISNILRLAQQYKIPVIPFGAGSSVEGQVIPVDGGISLDLTLMNQILETCPDDFCVRVQPGVTRLRLNKHLEKYGLFFPVDPGADATIGGMAATNASGTNAYRYGVMRDQVLGLEIAMANGEVLTTGGMAAKSSAGYDLTSLFVGSEGTLGVFTELTLQLYPIPEHIITARAVFANVEAATKAAVTILNMGLRLGRVELVDERTVIAVNQFKDTDFIQAPTLFLEFSGTKQNLYQDVEITQKLIEKMGCLEFLSNSDTHTCEQLWTARHDAAHAILASAPGKSLMTTDVCVPLSVLPEAIERARKIIEDSQLDAAILGHVGDGNFHAAVVVDFAKPDEVIRAKQVNREIVMHALQNRGTCTGEHGIGIGKREYMQAEHGDALSFMKQIKQLADPTNILNPGKIFLSEGK